MHDSEAARLMKGIRRDLEAGREEEEVPEGYLERYGSQILSAPRAVAFHGILTAAPAVFFLASLGVLLAILHRWTAQDSCRKKRPLTKSLVISSFREGGAKEIARPAPTAAPRLAVRGLYSVMLLSGREELGKPEIETLHEGYRYQFVSEPTRATFASDPERYSIQNDSCPVIPGAPIDPGLFAVHQGRIYAFATGNCVTRFKATPGDYVPTEK